MFRAHKEHCLVAEARAHSLEYQAGTWFKQQVSQTACEMSNRQPLHPCFSALRRGLNGFKLWGKKARWTRGKSELLAKAQDCGRWEKLQLLSGGVEGEVLVKHSCLFVWSDQPPCMVGLRLISPFTEQGSKGELTVLGGTRQARSYRLGIDMVPWGRRVLLVVGGGGYEATRRSRGDWWKRLTHWECLWRRQLMDTWE